MGGNFTCFNCDKSHYTKRCRARELNLTSIPIASGSTIKSSNPVSTEKIFNMIGHFKTNFSKPKIVNSE